MIIGINGKIGSGKDTVGSIIQYLTSECGDPNSSRHRSYEAFLNKGGGYAPRNFDQHYVSNWEIKKFAAKLKTIASLLTGISVEKFEDQEFKKQEMSEEWGMTYRVFLQKLGTETMRDGLHTNVWVNALFADVDRKISIEEEKRLKSIWKNINTRCTNSNYEKFHRYGGIGIINEFKDFNDFVNWSLLNGYTNKLTLDRKDGKSNYNKFNCRWVTVDLQSFNKLKYTNSKSNYKGVSKTKVNDKNSYIAQIQFKGKKENLGYFKTEEETKVAYDKRYLEILKILEEENSQKLYKYKNIIITDMRFVNEMEAVKKRGGITIRVNRPCEICGGSGYHKMSCPVSKSGEHYSETAIDRSEFDYIINNDSDIQSLIEKVREILIKERLL